MRYYISPPPASPFTRIVAAIFAILAIAGAFVFGLLVLAIAAALGALLWAGFSIRGWWLRRSGRVEGPGAASGRRDAIEAEYTVISRRRD